MVAWILPVSLLGSHSRSSYLLWRYYLCWIRGSLVRREIVSITDALIHCLQRTLSDCFGSFPVGSPVVCKAGEILFWQYSSGWGVVVQYIMRFELEGAATSPLPVGGPALLCIYCSSHFWKIKFHSWHHSSFWISAVPSASSLCVSHSNASTSFGLGQAACSLDQKCQFYLSNGLAPSNWRVYRSAQCQFINFCTLDGYVSSNGSLMNKPCCVFVPT